MRGGVVSISLSTVTTSKSHTFCSFMRKYLLSKEKGVSMN